MRSDTVSAEGLGPRGRVWAWVAAGVALLLLALQASLLLSPQSLWTVGSGVLRGTRRAFALASGDGFVASWDSLGLLAALCIAVTTAAGRASARSALGVAAVAGLATLNVSMLVAGAWSLVAIACTVVPGGRSRARWSAGVAAVLSAGVGLSVLAVQAVPRVLHSPTGHGGALDASGISLIRHILTGSVRGVPIHLVAAPPLLILLASVFLGAGSSRGMMPIAVGAGPLLLLKLYPLIELATRSGAVAEAALMIPGILVGAWGGFTRVSSSRRQGLAACGGTLALLAARLPAEAVVWAVAWVCIARDTRHGLIGAVMPGALTSWLSLAAYAGADPGSYRFAACMVLAAGSTLALDRPVRGARWIPGFVLTGLLALTLVPPIAPRFWLAWSGKLRPVLPSTWGPWVAVTAGIVTAAVMRSYGASRLEGLRDRVGRITHLAQEAFRRWASPSVDVVAVVWVALERFGWQGVTLWLPRRVLSFLGVVVSWFQTAVLPVIGRMPLHLMGLVRSGGNLFASAPGWFALAVAAVLSLAWLR